MIIHTTPPPNWDKLSKAFGVKWEGNHVVTYGGEIYCAAGKVDPDVLVHEMVHVEQQKGQDMEALSERYMNDVEYRREVETAAHKAQCAFLEATITDPAELWCKKYTYAKIMARMYNGAFTMESASGIMNLV